jgi:hypothetical protein
MQDQSKQLSHQDLLMRKVMKHDVVLMLLLGQLRVIPEFPASLLDVLDKILASRDDEG